MGWRGCEQRVHETVTLLSLFEALDLAVSLFSFGAGMLVGKHNLCAGV